MSNRPLPAPAFQRILVPTDFSDLALAALRHAWLFVEHFRSALHVLHVVEDPISGMALEGSYALPPDFTRQLRDNAEKQLAAIVPALDRSGQRVELAVREGSPFVEIVRYARDQSVDLIVMGTHGRGPIAHMLLGSVTEQVVRKAPCPVFVVRDAAQRFQLP